MIGVVAASRLNGPEKRLLKNEEDGKERQAE
jgi:hypothetical protein